MLKITTLPPILLAITAIGLTACEHKAPSTEHHRPTLIREINISQTQESKLYSGEIRARHETDLSFRIGGKVLTRKVDVGTQVKKGMLLAQLDPSDVNLSSSAALAAVASAQADLSLAQSEFERTQNLFNQKFISASALDAKRTSLRAAEAKLRQISAQANVAKNQVTYTNLNADQDGVVTAVPVEAGQVVSAGQVVAKLANPGEKDLLIYIAEGQQALMQPGRTAQVALWADPSIIIPAKIRELAPSADPATRTYAVRLTLPPDERFSLGATASAIFPEKLEDSILLPLPAVMQHEGKTIVWKLDANNIASPQPVTVKTFREDGVLITAGLQNADRIVVAGGHTLITGQKVNPIAEDTPPALDIKR